MPKSFFLCVLLAFKFSISFIINFQYKNSTALNDILSRPKPMQLETAHKELQEVAEVEFAGCGESPASGANWGSARRKILDVLVPLKLPSDAVLLVGSRDEEMDWARAAKLSGFIPSHAYFSEQAS